MSAPPPPRPNYANPSFVPSGRQRRKAWRQFRRDISERLACEHEAVRVEAAQALRTAIKRTYEEQS